ncbi:MAG: S9 family peptidase [Crocinitomicaceae bacterium]|nr:S9 family peptidase [Crocinitomicaceae bacterium]
MKNLFLLAGILLSISSIGQDRMTPELLWKLKRIGEISVSPDNSTIAFTQREYKVEDNSSESNIYLVPVGGGTIKQLTTTKGSEFNITWRNDSKVIYYLAKGEGGVNVFAIDAVSGIPPVQISYVDGGMTGFKFSADESILVYSNEVKMEKYTGAEFHSDMPNSNVRVIDDLMYRHWSDWEDGMRSHVFFLNKKDGKFTGKGKDLLEGENFESPLKPFGGIEHFTISPDQKTILYVCKKSEGKQFAVSTNADIYAYDIATGSTTNLSAGMKGYDVDPSYSEDGSKIAWLSMEEDGYEADKNDIVIYDGATKTISNITAGFDITVDGFVWSPKGDKIYFKSVKEACVQLFEYDFKSKQIRQITSGDHDYTSLELAGDFIIGGRMDMNHPTDIFKVSIKKGEETQLTDVNKDIYSKIKTGTLEKRWVTTTDGKKQLVWVIFPPDFDKTKKYPALLYCQGGPQSAVSQFFSYRWNFQLMAANDYIIIAPNRRGLPGFGQEWNDAIREDWGGQPMEDYLAAVDEIKKEPYVNADKIGAVGASYGGYSVYYLAGIHENRFKCFISHCGLFNLESWYGTTEELFFANSDIGGDYYGVQSPQSYLENSPHRKVQNWNTPMLIFHGEQDFRVPLNQGMEAFQALQLKGIESKMVLFPDENHFVLTPQNAIIWHREFYSWLDHYLK